MPTIKRKPPKTQKLSINGERRGRVEYRTAFDAPSAAREATKLARQGYTVTVQPWQSLGTKRNIMMRCAPTDRKGRTVAACELTPAFKKQIRGR